MNKNIGARVCTLPHHKENLYISAIVAKSPLLGQLKSYRKLTDAIHQRELTESLEILERKGIKGNSAIYVLSTLQNLGVVL